MNDLYYVGDTVNLRFFAESPAGKVKPTSGTVSIYSPEGEIIHNDAYIIDQDVIRYEISSKYTAKAGNYQATFDLNFEDQKKTHVIPFVILPRGIAREAEDTPVIKLDPAAVEEAVEDAIQETIRALRKKMSLKDAIRISYETAQQKTGRRIDQ
jgi:hypothetical protein